MSKIEYKTVEVLGHLIDSQIKHWAGKGWRLTNVTRSGGGFLSRDIATLIFERGGEVTETPRLSAAWAAALAPHAPAQLSADGQFRWTGSQWETLDGKQAWVGGKWVVKR